MEITTFMNWPIPDENKDPWYKDFVDLVKEFDSSVGALLNTAGNLIIPLGTVTWNASFKEVTWTDDFLIPIVQSGFYLRIKYGPDLATRKIFIDNGERLIIRVPTTSAQELEGFIDKVSGSQVLDPTIFTLGFIHSNKLFIKLPTVIVST